MDNFNQSGQSGIRGRLENAVLATDDPVYRGVQVPAGVLEGSDLPAHRGRTCWPARSWSPNPSRAYARSTRLDEFATYQTTLPELGQRTGLSFDDNLSRAAEVDSGQMHVLETGPRALPDLGGIEW